MFFVHGDVWGFDPAFAGGLGGASRAPNVASWLARRGVDVWGIDLRWVLVPAHTPDRTFMRSWGPDVDIQDIRVATTVERVIRGLTGSGFGPTALLGWSRGGFQAYTYANYESRLPAGVRNVDALIPAETVLQYAPKYDESRRTVCTFYRDDRRALERGIHAADNRVVARFGRLALADPAGPSPIISGVTNRGAVLLIGTNPHQSFSPWYHLAAGIFNSAGEPRGLKYTPTLRFTEFFSQASAFETQTEYVESEKVWCGKADALVDNLRSVDVPVLYLGAAGGFGDVGSYSTHLLGSDDVTHLIVRLAPVGQEGDDFSHVDLWQASNAPLLAWTPLLNWLRTH